MSSCVVKIKYSQKSKLDPDAISPRLAARHASHLDFLLKLLSTTSLQLAPRVWVSDSDRCCLACRMATATVEAIDLRAELKEWERAFAAANGGKKAGRQDIKGDPDIGNGFY